MSATRRHRNAPPIPVVLVGAMLALLGLAFALSRPTASAGGPQTGGVDVDGEGLPLLVEGQADAAVGLPAPALQGIGFDGAPVAYRPGGGRPSVVPFGAHWCGFCQQEVAGLAPWLAGGGAEALGFDLVAVSTGVDETAPNYPPSAWFEREGWPAPVLLDSADASAAAAFGLSGYPFFVLVDEGGVVVGRAAGAMGTEAFSALAAQLGT